MRLVLAALLGAAAIGCSVGLLATSAFLISKASTQPPILYLTVAIVSVRAFGIGRGVFRYAERLTGHDAAFRSLRDLRLSVYDRLAVTAPASTNLYRDGDLLTRLVADVDAMLDLHLRVMLPYAVAVLVSAGSVALVVTFLPSAGIALAVALLVGALLVPGITLRLVGRTQSQVAPAVGRLTADAVTLVDGAAELVALGRTDHVMTALAATDHELASNARRAAVTQGFAAALGVLAQGGAIIAAIILGTQAVNDGSLDGLNFAVVVLVPLAAYEAVLVLPAAAVTLARVRVSAQRIVEVIDAPDLVPDPVPTQSTPTSWGSAQSGSGTLVVNALQAGWRPNDWVVGPVDFEVAPGRSLAIVGASGAGKSTLAAALIRLAPAVGTVSLAGVDLAALSGDDVRRAVVLAQQDAHLFDTTLAENVRLARRELSDDQISDVLTELGLGAWLAQLPAGLDTRVGRYGNAVSGGQRQRIALARALVGDHAVVIADEPTEHLDAATARQVMDSLHRRCAHRILIVITHRNEAAHSCDQVVRLNAALSAVPLRAESV